MDRVTFYSADEAEEGSGGASTREKATTKLHLSRADMEAAAAPAGTSKEGEGVPSPKALGSHAVGPTANGDECPACLDSPTGDYGSPAAGTQRASFIRIGCPLAEAIGPRVGLIIQGPPACPNETRTPPAVRLPAQSALASVAEEVREAEDIRETEPRDPLAEAMLAQFRR